MGVSGYYFYFKVNDRFRHFDMGTALNASKFLKSRNILHHLKSHIQSIMML